MKRHLLLMVTALASSALTAQENVQDHTPDHHAGDSGWYASPWVWIAGAAIFILLLVALTKEKNDDR